ncbi:MAG: ECF-type sigma factor [Pseudomonadota bacterium]|nr:ECF-type sigma factor [Pseudomonadota bacterium]
MLLQQSTSERCLSTFAIHGVRQGLRVSSRASHALDVDRLLTELQRFDDVAAEIVSLRVFGGMSIEETAEVLSLSVATVNRRWVTGKTWALPARQGKLEWRSHHVMRTLTTRQPRRATQTRRCKRARETDPDAPRGIPAHLKTHDKSGGGSLDLWEVLALSAFSSVAYRRRARRVL